jgi:ABC-2 type transport system ATP-binding protein
MEVGMQSSSSDVAIEIKSVTKSFDRKHTVPVISDISLTVNKGEILGLIGPSGAGKTTLIRLMTGALRADSGEIFINHIKVPSMKLLSHMGNMPQNDAVYLDLTGKENLEFFGGLYKLKGAVLKERVSEVLQLLGLYADKDKLVQNYSGGMKKRLSLAATLIHQPSFLLLDEPTVGIDPILRKTIWDQFYRLRDKGTAIVVTTHVMDEASKCDRTALIYQGKLVADDTPENLMAKTVNGNIEEIFFMAKGQQL